MIYYLKNRSRGFTLIELLVTISIIGLIASAAFFSFSVTQMKARDAQRKSDLVQTRKALLLYAADHGGLPLTGFGYNNSGLGAATNTNKGALCYSYGDLEDFLDGTDPDVPAPVIQYIKMPHDPRGGGCGGISGNYGYMYYHTATCGTLFAHLERPTPADSDSCKNTCASLSAYLASLGMNYCVDVRP